ncbi:N-acetylmuramoyl-L-alanine amidase [Mesobacillus subterraneus]|uniref:N-acetylmuramoyl-L-alanine amidase n=1 Tax=Mesobacillus subterraneus TaxID=285983 RepID=UPI00203ECD25|nr:N-acetylmuramoyl-L-alanine amidase [Mesobacillus subterraneus]MCM3663681.1 N-acetylmuramoyl-L-alanine amidase [Mesobacillus subterraneus]MCM3683446.1 N-acetylmuramoyl-L-alanine amidase [Mesobacillus subterraneus]
MGEKMYRRGLLDVLSILLLLSGGCSAGIEEKAVVKVEARPKPEDSQPEVQVPVIRDFMPKLNFVPRSDVKTHIVLHFSSNAVMNPENPYVYDEVRKTYIEYEVSPHYMIDRNGEIYYLLPESRAARHAGKGDLLEFPDYRDRLNKYSIGIELMAIGTEAEMAAMMSSEHYKKIPMEHIGYTDAQYAALILLLDDIITRNKKIKRDREHIIGHDEYAPERKTDPGSLFDWAKVLEGK